MKVYGVIKDLSDFMDVYGIHEEVLKATVQKSESMQNLVSMILLFDIYKNKLLHGTEEKWNQYSVSSISYLLLNRDSHFLQ